MTSDADPGRELLRHIVATLAYRGGKVLRGPTSDFSTFRANEQTRTPVEILAHIGDLVDWALWLAKGEQKWNNPTPQGWERAVQQFFEALREFEQDLGSVYPLGCPTKRLYHRPVTDGRPHVERIAILCPVAVATLRS